MRVLLELLLCVLAHTQAKLTNAVLSQTFIHEINAKATTWTAGRNFDESTSTEYLQGLLGGKLPLNASKFLVEKPEVKIDPLSLPRSFDAREHWPNCTVITQIRDQSQCGSCWAVAAASVMSDRICIHSNAEKNVSISAIDLVSCCGLDCGTCGGGWAELAFNYWVKNGLVTGGEYNSGIGCKPYPFPNCKSGGMTVLGAADLTPKCEHKCSIGGKNYYDDLYKGKTSYHIKSYDVAQIQNEIMQNGPVEAGMTVYIDFYAYKSGVYHHTIEKIGGGHYVRLIGWGEENGIPYWLGANSWCDRFGDKGFFKILRGSNECGIEKDVFAGMPV